MVANISIEILAVDDAPYLLIMYNGGEQVVYRASEEDLVVNAEIAVDSQNIILYGDNSLALVVLFDPDEGSLMNITLQKENMETGEFSGEYQID